MTLADPSPTDTIDVTYDLAAPPAKVWRALTEPALLARWLMPNDLRAEVGHRFTFTAQPMPGWDGVVHCEVLEVEPERRLAYSWRGGSDGPGSPGGRLDTVVRWTLTPSASGGTALRLEHAGFTPLNRFAFDAMSRGWGGKLAGRIADVVATL
jgi:uncharacterized protein YndB with AHSA1/START domain